MRTAKRVGELVPGIQNEYLDSYDSEHHRADDVPAGVRSPFATRRRRSRASAPERSRRRRSTGSGTSTGTCRHRLPVANGPRTVRNRYL